MGKRSDKTAATRAKIIAAAKSLHRSGDFSVADAAKLAGVGTATAYRHFPGIYDLRREIEAEAQIDQCKGAFILGYIAASEGHLETDLARLGAMAAFDRMIEAAPKLFSRPRRSPTRHKTASARLEPTPEAEM